MRARAGRCLLALVLLVLQACAAQPPSARGGDRAIVPLEPRVDVVTGRTLVLPVSINGPLDPALPLATLLDDGRRLASSLHWISVAPEAEEARSWLPPAGVWSSTPAAADRLPPGAGFWAIVVAMPADALGQGLWLGGDRIALNWLPDPSLLERGTDSPWRRPLDAAPAADRIEWLVEPEWRHPARRWRYRLLTRGLEPAPPGLAGEAPRHTGETGAGPGGFADPVLEAWAALMEARWQVGLAWLWRADRGLADRLKRRLVATVEFGGGALAPAWPTAQADLDTLLADLTNPRLAAGERASRARLWLDSLPPAAAWIIDDAGMRDALTGRPLATIGVASLSDRATLAWAAFEDAPASPDLVPLEPGTTRQMVAVIPESARGAAPVTVHAGRWSVIRSVAADRVPARPPGASLGPLFADWAMEPWLAGTPSQLAERDWATAALLTRAEPSQAPGPPDGAARMWTVIVECRAPSPVPAGEDTVRLWFGPFGAPTAILRATARGVIVEETEPAYGLGAGAGIVLRDDRWIVQLHLPEGLIESDGALRLAIERIDPRGRHTAWPRPMLPWQAEPGRAVIDLGAWGGVTAR